MKYRIPLIIIILTSVLPASGKEYIRNIELVRLNVFDRELENGDNFLYRLANKFHIVTKERIIRQELLFKEGDSLAAETLDQSLRNIRALPFIGEISVIKKPVSDDSVDLEIITEDLWTTAIGFSGEGGGGLYGLTIYADEKNVAGSGIGIETNLQFTTDKNNGYLIYITDRRLLGTRLWADIRFGDLEYQKEFSLALYRPFYSLDTRWSFGGSFSSVRLEQRLFYQGEEYFRYKHDYLSFDLLLRRAFGKYTTAVPGLLFAYSEHDYSEFLPQYPDFGIIPADETFSGPGVELRLSTQRFKTATYLDEFGTTEDLREHVSLKLSSIWSGPTFGGDYQAAFVNIGSGFFTRMASNIYAGLKNGYSNYYTGNRRERIINRLESIMYIKPSIYHLISLRFLSLFAWRQQDDYQVVLGGINGLRGYPDRYFEGTRLLLMNAEYRFFTPLEILTVGLGGAVFADAGYVWDDGEDVRFKDIVKDIGIGLRFGLTKSTTARIIRFDLARALDRDNWYLSFSTVNLFDLARFQ